MEQQKQIIKIFLEEILLKLTVSGEINIIDSEECPQFVVRTQEGGVLIGEKGKNLVALNHLIKKMVEKEFERQSLEKIQFFLDINDYHAKRIEELKNTARMACQRVKYFKKDIELDPMSSYERRVIHAFLAEYPDVITESVGEDPNRRIVVKSI